MTERLTTGQIEAIRNRTENAIGYRSNKSVYPDKAFDVLDGDVPALLAEIERLRSYISRIPVNCVFCGDTYQADFEREVGLYNCEGCDGDDE